MTDAHREMEATLEALDGLKAFAQQRSDLANAARARREATARARRKAQREAARKAEVEQINAETAEEASTYRPEGPVCGALYHDSFGREVACGLYQGHEEDDPTCDAGNGVTWDHYDA